MNKGIVRVQKTGGGNDDVEQIDMTGDTRERNVQTIATTSAFHGPHNEQDVEMDAEKTTGDGQQHKEVKVRDGIHIPPTSLKQ
jgi:hypothetical protein